MIESQLNWYFKRNDIIAIAIIFFLEIIFTIREIPLPGLDFAWYTEPGVLLATEGVARAPSLCHFDYTYGTSWGWYPPGYPLILSAWVRLFGSTLSSILGFYHLMRVGYFTLLYMIMRFRFTVPYYAAIIAILLVFPWFGQPGRPDQAAMFFGTAAWLSLCGNLHFINLFSSAIFLALGLLISPVFGAQFAINIACDIILRRKSSIKFRFFRLICLALFTLFTGSAVWVAFLLNQPSPLLLIQQFIAAATLRGAENRLIPMALSNPYMIVFFCLPFIFASCMLFVGPSIYQILRERSQLYHEAIWTLFTGLLIFISSVFWWLVVSAGPFVTGFHYGLPAKAILCGVLFGFSFGKIIKRLLVTSVACQLITLLYFEKTNILYLFFGVGSFDHTLASAFVFPGGRVALDNILWCKMYQKDRTINLHWFQQDEASSRYRVSSKQESICPDPDVLLISEYSFCNSFASNSFKGYILVDPSPTHFLFKNVPTHPFKYRVFLKQ